MMLSDATSCADVSIMVGNLENNKLKKYTYEEALKLSLEYFNGDDLAAKVFVDKYALKNEKDEILEPTPREMHKRLAAELYRAESKYPNAMSEEEIFNLLDRFKYIVLQGSPMSAIGNPYKLQSLGNCFVIESPYDSYGGICKSDQELAQLMKRRAGTGLDLSNIRPKGLPTNNAAGTTDGIGVFMERFSNTCREVAQNGRRGAELQSIAIEHPEVETFITIKQDKTKVTGANVSVRLSDEFMRAVKNDEKFKLKWPVDSEKPVIEKEVMAKDLWDKIINCAWTSAEPGIFYWSNVIKNSPADVYAEKNELFRTRSSNPCFSGDTLIAVADGRNAITIKQLAEENKDVPVYSVDKFGKVSIKTGRNPRITGMAESLIRVHLDGGDYLDTTPNHQFMLLNGTKIEAKDLKRGDSLPRFTKSLEPVTKTGEDYYRVYCNTLDASIDKVFEHRLIAKFHNQQKWDDIYNHAKNSGFANTGGLVVHHKDYNSLNNSPDNLAIMTFREHSELHASIDTKGEKNGKYCGITSDELKVHGIILTKKLNRRFSRDDWSVYAKENNLPQSFSEFRQVKLGTKTEFAKLCAIEVGIEYMDTDPRVVKTYQSILEQGYKAEIIGNEIYVTKNCETCKNDFKTLHQYREFSFCSRQCSTAYVNTDSFISEHRVVGINKHFETRATVVRQQQAKIYSDLKFELKREPKLKEWESACALQNIPRRIGKNLKYSFKSYEEVQEAGDKYNHKVVKIEELPGDHVVYNITVDDNHTVGVITSIHKKRENDWFSGVFTFQCGEIPMGVDSCRLTVLNLLSFVKNPFTNKAKFDYDLFEQHTIKAQRIMDDIVDLELEQIDKIIKKVKLDPEPIEVKRVELDLWKHFKESCELGRRTGLGITALGDCVAALNIKYGTEESIKITEKIYKTLAINAYKSTCIMAKERGSFPIFEHKLEEKSSFIMKITNSDKELTELYKKHGRRNIALTTTAPAGSVSTLTQTSSGIEPVYLSSYLRRKKINPSDKNAKIDFIDASGDKWQEFIVYHHGVKTWMDITGETDIKKSPYWQATSNEIDWVASVEIQAAAQRWLCHAVSKTCNLPKDASKETVSQVYMKAWESGCKGFTVYRDGCRDGVLLAVSDKKDKEGRPTTIIHADAPKRHTELPCELYTATVKGQKWTVLIGLLDEKPYEIFTGLSENLQLPAKCTQGKIVKVNKGQYNLHVDVNGEDLIIKDIIKVFDNPESAWATRMLSLSMRHGVSVDFIVDQLGRDGGMGDYNKVISRILKKFIKDGAKVRTSAKCPSCSSTDLTYQEGCVSCTCGYSKCN